MELFETKNDPVLQQDLENTVNRFSQWERLRGSSFFITGATGLVGASLTKTLCCANRILGLDIKLNLLVRDKEKAYETFGDLIDRENIRLVIGDVTQPVSEKFDADYIIHGAAITNSKMMVTYPVETIMTAVNGTKNILDLAKERMSKSVVYLSSMEVYGRPDEDKEYTTESDLGYINILSIRSCYPEGKRISENLCASYCSEYDIPVKIARLAQTFGAGITKNENRVFAQFARSLINKNDIVLHTAGNSYGNYCYTSECIEAILFILLNGSKGEAYNIVNESTNIMIRDMAQMIADMSDGNIKVIFDIPDDALKYGYAPSVKMHLSGKKLEELGWKANIDLKEMYSRLIESMKYTQNY